MIPAWDPWSECRIWEVCESFWWIVLGGVIKLMTLNTENIVKNLCTFAQKIILQDTEPLNEVYLFCFFFFLFKSGLFHVAHVGLKLTNPNDPCDSASWVTGLYTHVPKVILYTMVTQMCPICHPWATWGQGWLWMWQHKTVTFFF